MWIKKLLILLKKLQFLQSYFANDPINTAI